MPSKEGYAIVEKKVKKLMEDGKFEEAYKILLRTQNVLFGTELNLLKHEDLQIIKGEILNMVPDIELRIESSRLEEQFNNGTIENSFEKGRIEY